MKGFISTAINERLNPSVDAPITAYYDEGAMVDIVGSVIGDDYDGDDLWYRLDNGRFLWSGGVNVQRDCSGLPLEERQHFLLSYREVDKNGLPDLGSKEPPNTLYFTNIELPADVDNIRVNELSPSEFANRVVQSVSTLSNQRNHVFIYVHGYQLFSSLKLDLLGNFVQSYMMHEANKIAKVLFFAWPAQGGIARKTVDDRSVRAGQQFTANNLFQYFEVLSTELSKIGKYLNLIVHSFGHQLLNGMLNPDNKTAEDKIPKRRIFENIFLMAPDVTHLAVTKQGETLQNYFRDKGGKDYHYQFSRLKDLANQVHIFHDKYDYLLYVSTKKFVEKGMFDDPSDLEIINCYRSLGNYGECKVEVPDQESRFTFWDLETLIDTIESPDLYDFPFRQLKENTMKKIDDVWNNGNYEGITGSRILFNLNRFPDHHRYLFTCKQVVDKVQQLLK